MKKVFYIVSFIIIMVIITGCGTRGSQRVEMEILSSFELRDLTGGNIGCSAGVYKDMIFYVKRLPDKFSVVFTDFSGKERKSFDIPAGKGPGEVMMSMGAKINNDIFYFYDLYLKRMSMFDLNGNFLDSIDYSDKGGIIIFYGFLGNQLYVHSINEVFVGEMDKNGNITKKIDHPVKGMPVVDEKVVGGMLETDPYSGEIYVGYGSKPFRIERYNKDLEKTGEYTYGRDRDRDYLVYKEGFRVYGDTLVNSLTADRDYVYSPHVGEREIWNSSEVIRGEYPVEVYAFSKESGKLRYIYESEKLPEHQGTFAVIGTYEDRLVLLFGGFGKSISNLSKSKEATWRGYAVVVRTKQ